jgi:Ca2+/H+ antiporter, TMEM165/GDT1 family
MNLAITLTVFGIIFIGELPDKTMFASVVMATRGRPFAVWLGAAAAFGVHVVIAVTLGSIFVHLLPYRLVQAIVALLFIGGAVLAFREAAEDAEDEEAEEAQLVAATSSKHRRTVVTAFIVIFLAEWGDLTQILTANLAAHYKDPLAVGLGSFTALLVVGAIAVMAGRALTNLPIALVRRVTGAVLIVLALVSIYEAVTGRKVLF